MPISFVSTGERHSNYFNLSHMSLTLHIAPNERNPPFAPGFILDGLKRQKKDFLPK